MNINLTISLDSQSAAIFEKLANVLASVDSQSNTPAPMAPAPVQAGGPVTTGALPPVQAAPAVQSAPPQPAATAPVAAAPQALTLPVCVAKMQAAQKAGLPTPTIKGIILSLGVQKLSDLDANGLATFVASIDAAVAEAGLVVG